MDNKFVNNYNQDLSNLLNDINVKDLNKSIELIKRVKKKDAKIILAGNGGSAALSSHVAVDFTKTTKIRATNFNEADLITCFANDYGYENWLSQALKSYAKKNDLVILVSSSGQSKNMINAANFCKKQKISLITFTGFSKTNNLRKLGKINFWCDSKSYNKVEMTHHVWLLMIVDYMIKFKST
jgi:D-sedoheptulose 7-phosphate isomerase